MVEKEVEMEAILKESVDLQEMPLLESLKCNRQVLYNEDAQQRLAIYGYNKLEEKKDSKVLRFLAFMWNPLSWVMEVAAIMALSLTYSPYSGNIVQKNWQDFVGIITLLTINATISFIEDNNARNAAASLMSRLALKAKVLRDGRWNEEDAAVLVPGDTISIKIGDIIPADVRLLDGGGPLKIDQSDLTGECLPVTKNAGDIVFSGSTCQQGEIEAVVIAAGVRTCFGSAAHSVDTANQVGHFQKVLTGIGNFCICSIVACMVIEIFAMSMQTRDYSAGIGNLLVLIIGGIPIAMPTVLSMTMSIGSHRLSQQGVITKRLAAIEGMAGMDVLCCDKTGTLTLNNLSVDKDLIEILMKDVNRDTVILMAALASRTNNQDAIDTAIVGMLDDLPEAPVEMEVVEFLPFNATDKRSTVTYIDKEGLMRRVSKGAPEQILDLAHDKSAIEHRVRAAMDKYAQAGFTALAVAIQDVPERRKESRGGPWKFVALLPLFVPPRVDSAETLRRALNIGINVIMTTDDQLEIAKETGRRLRMGTNMYPSSVLFVNNKDNAIAALPIVELIEKADGFAGVSPEHKYEIVKRLQARHICGLAGDGVNDAPALKKADIGIAVADATDAARSASDIILTEPGLSVIINAVLTSRAIFQRMKSYTIYAVTITIRTVLGFMLLAVIWKFDFPPFMVLIIAILNDGIIMIMTIATDKVKPSPLPDCWKLSEILATGITLGSYLAIITVIFFWAAFRTYFFPFVFNVSPLKGQENFGKLASAVYLQVSIISQALIFVTRSHSWSFCERPSILHAAAFFSVQLIATLIAVYANWSFAAIQGIGWGWAGIIWLYNIVFYIPLDIIKFLTRYALSGRSWDFVTEQRIAFTRQKQCTKEARQLECALLGFQTAFTDTKLTVEHAIRPVEMSGSTELHTLKDHLEALA
ncbi:hypothetical protein MKW92_030719 [Papaver armeniacum]|nr:hypothetical protein MKW92_030719 [Papaver armeniacum]